MLPKYFIAIALMLSVADFARSIGHRYDVDDTDEDYDIRDSGRGDPEDEDEDAVEADEDEEEEPEEEEEEGRREEVRRANVSALLPPTSSPVPFTTSTPQEDQEVILEKAETDTPTTTQSSPTSEPPEESQSERQKLTYHSFVRKGSGDERILKKETDEEEDSKYLSRGIGRGSLRDYSTTERGLRRDSSRNNPARVSSVAPSRGYAVRETPAEGCNPAINTVADVEATKPQNDWRRARMSRRRDTTEATTEAPSRGRWQRGNTRGRTTTTTATPSTAKDWRARAIDRRRGIRQTTTTTTTTTTEGPLRLESRGSAGKKYTSPPRRDGKERKPKGHYVEYEESELFEDGKPVVKKKRVQKLLDGEEEGGNGTSRASKSPEDGGDDSAEQPSDPAHRISSSTRQGKDRDEEDSEEEEYRLSPSSRNSKKRKNDFHKNDHYDLEKYFHHRDDDEDHYGSHYGHGSESRGVRRKHYDPYQDYFDFVYSISHPHDEHSHHNHHGLHGQPSRHRSHGVEEDSVPEGSSFRKRYYKAWHTSDVDGEDEENKKGKRESSESRKRRRKRGQRSGDYWEDEL